MPPFIESGTLGILGDSVFSWIVGFQLHGDYVMYAFTKLPISLKA